MNIYDTRDKIRDGKTNLTFINALNCIITFHILFFIAHHHIFINIIIIIMMMMMMIIITERYLFCIKKDLDFIHAFTDDEMTMMIRLYSEKTNAHAFTKKK